MENEKKGGLRLMSQQEIIEHHLRFLNGTLPKTISWDERYNKTKAFYKAALKLAEDLMLDLTDETLEIRVSFNKDIVRIEGQEVHYTHRSTNL